MTVRLRAHHLLCLLTYAGKGYGPAFTTNLNGIAGRTGRGEDILIVSGPDDICAPLLKDPEAHCWRASASERDCLAATSVGEILARRIVPGVRLKIGQTQATRMRQAFSAGETRAACKGCEWYDLCSTVADADYSSVMLYPPARS